MKNNLLIALFSFACLLNLGCENEDEPTWCDWDSDPIPAKFDNYRYQPGTYWVYQEVTSNDLDSIWVASVSLDTVVWISEYASDCNNIIKTETESHIMDLQGSRLGNMHSWYLQSTGVNWADPADVIQDHMTSPFMDGLRIFHDREAPNWGYDVNDEIYGTPATYWQQTLASMQVAGGTFTNVISLRSDAVDFDFLPQPTAWDTYWTENGIIRWDVRDSLDNIIETWDLVRWNVIR